MYYSPLQRSSLQGLLNPFRRGNYVSPLAAALNQRPPGNLLNFGVTPSALLGVLHEQDQQRYAMIGAAMYRYSSLGLTGLSTEEILVALGAESADDENVVENDVAFGPIDLAACRESLKTELAELEKQRKVLSGQQNALNRRFAEVEGKFQLIKQLESEITTNNAMNAETHDEAD